MKRLDVILSIVGGLLVLAVSVTLGVITIVGFFTPFSSSGPYTTPVYEEPDPAPGYEEPDGDFSTLATGDPGSPVALAPDLCPPACFTEADLSRVAIGQAPYYALGLWPTVNSAVDQPVTTAGAEHAVFADLWQASGNFADECFFTSGTSPLVEPVDAIDVRDDPVSHISGGALNGASIEQWARIFPDTESAAEYMVALDAGLEACTRYTDENGYPTDVILRQAAIDVPENIAALGWVRKMVGSDDRFYVTDMQRANLVIRTVSFNNGSYTDALLREFMEDAADELGVVELP